MKRPRGRPPFNEGKIIIAVGVKLSSTKPHLSLLETCIAVNKACKEFEYASESELCIRTLRKHVNKCIAKTTWKGLERKEHMHAWLEMASKKYGESGYTILDIVEYACKLLLTHYTDNVVLIKNARNETLIEEYDEDSECDMEYDLECMPSL